MYYFREDTNGVSHHVFIRDGAPPDAIKKNTIAGVTLCEDQAPTIEDHEWRDGSSADIHVPKLAQSVDDPRMFTYCRGGIVPSGFRVLPYPTSAEIYSTWDEYHRSTV